MEMYDKDDFNMEVQAYITSSLMELGISSPILIECSHLGCMVNATDNCGFSGYRRGYLAFDDWRLQ
jgi:hypothetical protein